LIVADADGGGTIAGRTTGHLGGGQGVECCVCLGECRQRLTQIGPEGDI